MRQPRFVCVLVLVSAISPACGQIRKSGCPLLGQSRVPPEALTGSDFVELNRTACYGSCPSYTVRIRGDGHVSWHGDSRVTTTGQATAQISAVQAKDLIEEFRTHEFWSLCDHYSRTITDNPTYNTTASIGGQLKQVSDYAASAPEFLRRLDRQIDAVADTHRWRHGEPTSERFGAKMTEECGLPKPGVTPLMCPANESTETIEALLRDNPAVDAADASGWTALMYAAYSSSDFVLDRLLTAGANPKARSAGRQTVLMAVISGYKQTRHKIEQLVSAGADINAADIEGRTALMFAVQRFWLPDLTAWLLDAGARTRIKDAKGKSAFDYLEAAFAENKQESAAHARVLELLSNARP